MNQQIEDESVNQKMDHWMTVAQIIMAEKYNP